MGHLDPLDIELGCVDYSVRVNQWSRRVSFLVLPYLDVSFSFIFHNSCLLMDLSLSHVILLWGPISSSSLDHAILNY